MKKLLILMLFSLSSSGQRVRKVTLQIVKVTSKNHFPLGMQGYGQGNVSDDDGLTGFDFTYSGCREIHPDAGSVFRKARWVSKNEITAVTDEVGTDRKFDCSLKITLKDYVYYLNNGEIATHHKPHI